MLEQQRSNVLIEIRDIFFMGSIIDYLFIAEILVLIWSAYPTP